MAKDKNRRQIMVGISIDENGVPRVRPLTRKEEKRFFKTHPNVRLPTFSPDDIEKGLEMLERQLGTTPPKSPSPGGHIPDPSTTSILGDPSAR